ncbi:MAG: sugar phosphate isomerase/epimerase [Firmicutes bacterium]|nr:sugar phosphate isomerase/epimerase [Bacillota bacterium]
MKIAVQLYSLRDVKNASFSEVLTRVKSLGYDGVEFAGFHEMKAEDLKDLLHTLDLDAMASHTSMNLLEESLDQVIAYNKIIGNQNIVIPYTEMRDLASYQSIMPKIKKITEQLSKQGFKVYYHNHAHEFAKFNDEYLLDKLFKDIPQLRLELDIYWAVYAGVDINAFMLKHQKHIDFIHAKDMIIEQDERSFASVGEGVIDFLSIHKLPMNYSYWIVENDRPKDDPFVNIERSIKYIRNLIKGDESQWM